MNGRMPIANCRLNWVVASALAVWAGIAPGAARAADMPKPPAIGEVIALVRSNLTGVTAAELDRAALEGLLGRFRGRVLLDSEAQTDAGPGSLARTNVFEDSLGSLRVARVGDGLGTALKSAVAALIREQKIKGLVLDLRFATGTDYAAAVAAADVFLPADKPQLDVGGRVMRSTGKADAVTLPVAILVNRQTSGAAEALAAVLRASRVGLLIGAPTAGEASLFREFPLSTGQRLRIATESVKLAGGPALPATGLRPDVSVTANLADERAFLDDPFRDLRPPVLAEAPASGTVPPRKRVNEAELVRRQKELETPDAGVPARRAAGAEPAKPLVRDPALARALDLLKGLLVVGRLRPL